MPGKGRGSEFVVLHSQVIRHSYVGLRLSHKLLLAIDTRHRGMKVMISLHIGPFMMVRIQRMERLWSQEQFESLSDFDKKCLAVGQIF